MHRPAALTLTQEEFERLRSLLHDYAGLWFGIDARPTIERRLQKRLSATGEMSFSSYLRRLTEGDPSELEEAVEACTVNETYVFRQEYQLKAFRYDILPRLARRERVLVWSAGCATGEEAYTIGSIILESGLVPADRVHVFGTDISRRCIAFARRGVYSATSFRGVTSPLYSKYFVKQSDGSRSVSADLKAICKFRHANLLSETAFPGAVDVIFCRNVLIHMGEQARVRVVAGFFNRLTPGGYLLLGHSESLLADPSPFEVVQLADDIVYRRPAIDDLTNRGKHR
jgi:chemotaxis protein methyltransferase CheR